MGSNTDYRKRDEAAGSPVVSYALGAASDDNLMNYQPSRQTDINGMNFVKQLMTIADPRPSGDGVCTYFITVLDPVFEDNGGGTPSVPLMRGTANNAGFALTNFGGDASRFQVRGRAGTFPDFEYTADFGAKPADGVYRVAVSVDVQGQEVKMASNGLIAIPTMSSSNPANANPTDLQYIGYHSSSGFITGRMTGKILDAGFAPRACTEQEMLRYSNGMVLPADVTFHLGMQEGGGLPLNTVGNEYTVASTEGSWVKLDGIESHNARCGHTPKAVFNGVDDYVDVDLAIDRFDITKPYSGSANFIVTDKSTDQIIFTSVSAGVSRFAVSMRSEQIRVSVYDTVFTTATADAENDVEYIVEWDWDGAVLSASVNGTEMAVGAGANLMSATAGSKIGVSTSTTPSFFSSAKIFYVKPNGEAAFFPTDSNAMVDTVSGTTFTNQGNGDISAVYTPPHSHRVFDHSFMVTDGVGDKLEVVGMTVNDTVTPVIPTGADPADYAVPTAGTDEITFTAGKVLGVIVNGVPTYDMTQFGEWDEDATEIPSANSAYDAGVIVSTSGLEIMWRDQFRYEALPTLSEMTMDGVGDKLEVQGLTPSDSVAPFVSEGDLGSEQVTNGGFDTDLSGWRINVSSRGSIEWDSGRLKVVNNGIDSNPAATHNMTQLVDGGTYLLTGECDIGTATEARVWVYGNSKLAESIFTSSGSFSVPFVADSDTRPGVLLYCYEDGNTGNYCLFDNISVREIQTDYAIPTAGTDEVTFTGGKVRGLLINGEQVYDMTNLVGKNTTKIPSLVKEGDPYAPFNGDDDTLVMVLPTTRDNVMVRFDGVIDTTADNNGMILGDTFASRYVLFAKDSATSPVVNAGSAWVITVDGISISTQGELFDAYSDGERHVTLVTGLDMSLWGGAYINSYRISGYDIKAEQYSVSIDWTSNGTWDHILIPTDSNGMYDTVSGTTFANLGTGDISARYAKWPDAQVVSTSGIVNEWGSRWTEYQSTGLQITDTATDKITVDGLTDSDTVTVESFEQDAVLGLNIQQDSGFDNPSEWSMQESWGVADGIATKTTAVGNWLYQTGNIEEGVTYLGSVNMLSTEAGELRLAMGSSSFIPIPISTGVFRGVAVSEGATFSGLHTVASFIGSVDDVTFRELLSSHAFPKAATDSITFANAGEAYGWISINGVRTYNLSEITADGTIPSHNPLFPDATVPVSAVTYVPTGRGTVVDVESYLPLTNVGGLPQNNSEGLLYVLEGGGTWKTYAELLATCGDSLSTTRIVKRPQDGLVQIVSNITVPLPDDIVDAFFC